MDSIGMTPTHGDDARRPARSRVGRAGVLALAALAAACAWPGGAGAADAYPSRAVRIVVPYAAGGGTDVLGRLVAARLSEIWRQSVLVDNRPGGGTVIGSELVARAPADGHTLVIGTPTHVVNATLLKKLPFDPIADFAPVSLLSVSPNLFVAHPSLPAKSVRDFIALARARPGEITYGSSGNGGTGHLAIEMMKQMAGISAVHVPYKGGGPALNALLGGEVTALVNNMIPTVHQVRAGRLRALGVTSARRSRILPDVPTIAEAGLPGFEALPWFGLMAPAGTPPAVVAKISADVATVLAMPAVRGSLESQGAETVGSSPEAFARVLREDMDKWRKVLTAAPVRGG